MPNPTVNLQDPFNGLLTIPNKFSIVAQMKPPNPNLEGLMFVKS